MRVTQATDKTQRRKLEARIIGSIEKIYTFQKIADFQYLPMCTSISLNNSNNSVDNQVSFQHSAFYDNFKFQHIDNYEHDLRKNSIPQLFILPPFFSRFDDPVNYAFRSEPVRKEQLDKLKQAVTDAEKRQQGGKGADSAEADTGDEQSESDEKSLNKSAGDSGINYIDFEVLISNLNGVRFIVGSDTLDETGEAQSSAACAVYVQKNTWGSEWKAKSAAEWTACEVCEKAARNFWGTTVLPEERPTLYNKFLAFDA